MPAFQCLPLLVLAGGQSRRMGRDKATLEWEGTPLLLRVIRRLAPVAAGVWVAARPWASAPARRVSAGRRRAARRGPARGALPGPGGDRRRVGGRRSRRGGGLRLPVRRPAPLPCPARSLPGRGRDRASPRRAGPPAPGRVAIRPGADVRAGAGARCAASQGGPRRGRCRGGRRPRATRGCGRAGVPERQRSRIR